MDVNQFWEHARVGANLNPFQEWMGPQVWGTVTPPAWSFGETPEEADQLAEDIVTGRKTGTSSLLWQYERDDIPLPEPSTLAIVLDGSDEPRALILTTKVRVVPFSAVDEQHALAESGSLGEWLRRHEALARAVDDGAHPFDPSMPFVLETLELLYPHPAQRRAG
ncbi:hypothetical protein GCM10025789_21360 [Tessaracoccus lubricantis]|uniref:ASCH domain-containing protein n=1 Tax=Tessaracoccus lubricantis TaxID=545543 RepID=A0ABP9FI60_9ACTN